MATPKHTAEATIRALPEDATWEDIQYRMYVLQKIAAGQRSLEEHGGIPQEDARKRFAKWRVG